MLHSVGRLSCALLALVCPLAASPFHGGAFRGPNLPPPSPLTPGGGAAAKGGPSSSGGGLWRSSDPATWSQWWALDRDHYLRQVSGASGPWNRLEVDGGIGPPAELRRTAIPELIRIVEREKDMDLLTASVMSLAKIGLDPEDEEGQVLEGKTLEAIRSLLGHSNQEVAESAILALGVLGEPAAAEQLAHILVGNTRASGLRKISFRSRTFAAYGLGVLGRRNPAEAVRSFCVHHLAEQLSTKEVPGPDLGVACVIAMGLIPLESRAPKGDLIDQGGTASTSREAQFRFLQSKLVRFGDRDKLPELLRRSFHHDVVLAYIPMALARLAKDVPGLRSQALTILPLLLEPKAKTAPVLRVGAVHALGQLADTSRSAGDVHSREVLLEIAKSGDRLERVLALAALGRIGGRGAGDPLDVVPRELRSFLMLRLAKGQTYETPWAALGVGLLEHGRAQAGEPAALGTLTTLRHALRNASSPDEVGSLCIALALAGDKEAIPLLLERADGGDETARGHAVTALGMLQADGARPLLRKMAVDGRRPALAREAAISLSLLGEGEIQAQLAHEAKTESFVTQQVSDLLALAYLGDRHSLEPLIEILTGRRQAEVARAYAAVALGIIFDKDPIPWNHPIAADVGWWRAPTTLLDPTTGRGVVDLF